jgi:peptidylamidoglycolate lyase
MRVREHACAALLVLAFSGCARPPHSQSPTGYEVVHGWPQVPENEMLDEVSAVAVDRHDNVFVLTRAGREWPESGKFDTAPIAKPTVFLFDGKSGRLLARWGAGVFALPHSITVDAKDQVWITDVALHQAFKFSHDGRLLLSLGERAKPGNDARHFYKPSDVAVGNDGSIFVADGYGNSRVVKFDDAGKFLTTWGSKGKNPGQFDLVHGLTIDNQGHVCVADRQNARIQCFDRGGRFLFQWKGPPFVSPQDLKFDAKNRAYVIEAGNSAPPDETGVLVLDKDGKVIERIGRWGNYDGQFVDPHWVAVDSRGAVYVADFEGKRVQKFVR